MIEFAQRFMTDIEVFGVTIGVIASMIWFIWIARTMRDS